MKKGNIINTIISLLFFFGFLTALILIMIQGSRSGNKNIQEQNNNHHLPHQTATSSNVEYSGHLVIDIPVGSFTGAYVWGKRGGLVLDKKNDEVSWTDKKIFLSQFIWFSDEGYLEYKIRNPFYFKPKRIPKVKSLSIFFEASPNYLSEKDDFPTDISVYFNDKKITKITISGDFKKAKKKYILPEWWSRGSSKYGEGVFLTIGKEGTTLAKGDFAVGERISDLKITDFDFSKEYFLLKISVDKNAKNKGGLNLFGGRIGSYNKPLSLTIEYDGGNVAVPLASQIIDNPASFFGKKVVLNVFPSGWSCPSRKIAYPEFLSRSALFWSDESGCIYGGKPLSMGPYFGFNPASPSLKWMPWLSIIGTVKADKEGIPYLEYSK